MLKQRILIKKLEGLRNQVKPLVQRKAELIKLREEAEVDLTEDKELSEEEMQEAEKIEEETSKELGEKEEEINTLNEKIKELEEELEEINSRAEEEKQEEVKKEVVKEKSKRGANMLDIKVRTGFFKGMVRENVKELVEREEVISFLEKVRAFKGQERAVTGAELGIPEIFLGMLKDNMHRYSKLIKHVNLKRIKGNGRVLVAGTIPEAVWTEMCANLNELSINFNLVEIEGYKVGGFIAICDATLSDTDINLANEIMDALGQAIGLAVDKAILYGKGVKMPVGIVTRLAEAAKPAYWGTNEPTWTNLATSNIQTLTGTGIDLFKAIFGAIGAVKSNYSDGKKFFAMNEATYRQLQMEGLSINVNGSIVSAMGEQSMPWIGGAVEFFDFIPVGDVIGGYGANYLLAEREGTVLAKSEHVRFLNDQTVFKGTARYDGRPVFGESFIAFNINNVAPTTTMTFAADTANV